jgi:hypothetical protein
MIGEPLWGELALAVGVDGQRSLWSRLDDIVVDSMARRGDLGGLDESLVDAMVHRLTPWAQIELAGRDHLAPSLQVALAQVRRVRVWQTLGERDDLCLEAVDALSKWKHPRIDLLVFGRLELDRRRDVIERFSTLPSWRKALINLCSEYNSWELLAWCGDAGDIARYIPGGAELEPGAARAAVTKLAQSGDDGLIACIRSFGVEPGVTSTNDMPDCEVPGSIESGQQAWEPGGIGAREHDSLTSLGLLYDSRGASLDWITTTRHMAWDVLEFAYGAREFSAESLGALAARDDAPDWVIEECLRRWCASRMPALRADHLQCVLKGLTGSRVGMLAAIIGEMPVRKRPDARALFWELSPVASLALLLEWFVGTEWRSRLVDDLATLLESELGGDSDAWDTFTCLVEGYSGSMGECTTVATLLSDTSQGK